MASGHCYGPAAFGIVEKTEVKKIRLPRRGSLVNSGKDGML